LHDALPIFKHSLGIIFRSNFGAGVGNGAMPMVDTGSSRTASLCVATFSEDNPGPLSGGTDGGMTACHPATHHKDIRYDFSLLFIAYGVRPLRNRAASFHIFIPRSHR